MATKVSNIGSLIKVQTPDYIFYINSRGLEVVVRGNNIQLTSELLEKSIEIPVAEVQNGSGNPVGNLDTVVQYINGLIQ